MSKHQSYSGKIPMLATAPSDPTQGDMYYNTATNVLERYDGTNWKGVIASSTTTSTSSSTSSSTTTTSSSTTTTSTSTTP